MRAWVADNITSAYMPYLSTTVLYNKPNYLTNAVSAAWFPH